MGSKVLPKNGLSASDPFLSLVEDLTFKINLAHANLSPGAKLSNTSSTFADFFGGHKNPFREENAKAQRIFKELEDKLCFLENRKKAKKQKDHPQTSGEPKKHPKEKKCKNKMTVNPASNPPVGDHFERTVRLLVTKPRMLTKLIALKNLPAVKRNNNKVPLDSRATAKSALPSQKHPKAKNGSISKAKVKKSGAEKNAIFHSVFKKLLSVLARDGGCVVRNLINSAEKK